MCLTQRKKKKEVAKKPIKCYKYFLVNRAENKLYSPYMGTEHEFKEGAIIEAEGEELIVHSSVMGMTNISKGYIHAYVEPDTVWSATGLSLDGFRVLTLIGDESICEGPYREELGRMWRVPMYL